MHWLVGATLVIILLYCILMSNFLIPVCVKILPTAFAENLYCCCFDKHVARREYMICVFVY